MFCVRLRPRSLVVPIYNIFKPVSMVMLRPETLVFTKLRKVSPVFCERLIVLILAFARLSFCKYGRYSNPVVIVPLRPPSLRLSSVRCHPATTRAPVEYPFGCAHVVRSDVENQLS